MGSVAFPRLKVNKLLDIEPWETAIRIYIPVLSWSLESQNKMVKRYY
jgi:hypothetical protein